MPRDSCLASSPRANLIIPLVTMGSLCLSEAKCHSPPLCPCPIGPLGNRQPKCHEAAGNRQSKGHKAVGNQQPRGREAAGNRQPRGNKAAGNRHRINLCKSISIRASDVHLVNRQPNLKKGPDNRQPKGREAAGNRQPAAAKRSATGNPNAEKSSGTGQRRGEMALSMTAGKSKWISRPRNRWPCPLSRALKNGQFQSKGQWVVWVCIKF